MRGMIMMDEDVSFVWVGRSWVGRSGMGWGWVMDGHSSTIAFLYNAMVKLTCNMYLIYM
jgi:hypothetical protein